MRLLTALVAAAGCGLPPPLVASSTEILWSDGAARLVIDKTVSDSFPDPMMTYSLRLEHDGHPAVVVNTATIEAGHCSLSASRLGNKHVAWAVNDMVCEELASGATACNDFSNMGCRSGTDAADPCCEGAPQGVRCACGIAHPDPTPIAALRWAATAHLDERLRAGAAFALARLGQSRDAVRFVSKLSDAEYPRIWIAAVRVQAGSPADDLARLRVLYRNASACDRDAIKRACGSLCTR